MRVFVVLLLLVSGILRVQAQVTSSGTEFWLTYMENLMLPANGQPSFDVVVSSEIGTQGELQIPAAGYSVPFTIVPDEPTVITLPANIYYPQGDEAFFNYGIRIIGDDEIDVQAYHHRLFFSEATLVHPVERLGVDYMVLAHADDGGGSPSEFVVLATQDGTVVRIIPSVLTSSFRPPGIPFEITLNAGQVFQIQALGDLSGSRVLSLDTTKPVAVFSGARQAFVNCQLADDHLFQQIDPIGSWGDSYYVVPFAERGGDQVRLLGLHDGSDVYITGVGDFELDEGEVIDLHIMNAVHITGDKAFAVGQFNESQECNIGTMGDPAFLWLQPTSRSDDRAQWSALTGAGTPEHYVNIVAVSEVGQPDVLLDDISVADQFLPMPDVPGVYWAQIELTEGGHTLTGNRGYQATAYGFGDYNSYTFHLGYDRQQTVSIDERALPTSRLSAFVVASGGEWPRVAAKANVDWFVLDSGGRLVATFHQGHEPRVDIAPGHYVVTSSASAKAYRLVVLSP